MRLFLTLALITVLLGCSHPVWVWTSYDGPKFYEEIRQAGYEPHPCGVVQQVYVRKLPSKGSSGHVPGTERVIEYDTHGKITGEWAMPVDSYVLAIENQSIIVRYDNEALKISKAGIIKVVPVIKSAGSYEECPQEVRDEFGKTSYLSCWKLEDLDSKNSRHVAYESVCT